MLYDVNNLQQIEGVIDGNLVKFRLPAATLNRTDLILSSRSGTALNQITGLTPKTFVNFGEVSNQADYVIISNRRLSDSGDGINYLEEYRDYRASQEGGGWNAKLIYIDDLEDQFGFGIRFGTYAISNFARYGVDKFASPLQQIFVIGKGFGPNVSRNNLTLRGQLLVQTYGLPASDNMMVTRSATVPQMICGIGRLSARTGNEIRDYLAKVKAVEANYNDTTMMAQTIDNKSWQKNVLHLAGGNNDNEQVVFRAYMENMQQIIEGPSYGANVSLLAKTLTDPIQVAQNVFLDSIIRSGLSLITFLGTLLLPLSILISCLRIWTTRASIPSCGPTDVLWGIFIRRRIL